MDISKLKAIGQMQNTFMWHVNIPMIPYVGVNNFEFLIRSTTIPGKTRNKTIMRYLGEQFNLPGAVEHDGEWTADVVMSEIHELFDILLQWNDLVPVYAHGREVNTIKTDVQIKLISHNKTVINKRFLMKGVYPGGYPEIPDLNQDNTEGFVIPSYVFHYDDLDYDTNNQLNF